MSARKYAIAAIALGMAALGGAAFADDAKSLPMINGEVTKVDSAGGKVTIKHEPITNLDMGAMTMAFKEVVANNQRKKSRVPFKKTLQKFRELSQDKNRQREKSKTRDRGQSL